MSMKKRKNGEREREKIAETFMLFLLNRKFALYKNKSDPKATRAFIPKVYLALCIHYIGKA